MNKARRKNIGEAITLLNGIADAFEKAKSLIESAGSEEREAYDSMPEGLQQGEKGEACDAAAEALEEVQSSLDELDIDDVISKLEDARQ